MWGEKVFILWWFVQAASSDDDDDEEDEEGLKASKKSKKAVEVTKVTDKMIKDWKTLMKKDPNPHLFREVTQAFKAAVSTTKGEGGIQCRYKVDDSSGRISRLYICITALIEMHYKLRTF